MKKLTPTTLKTEFLKVIEDSKFCKSIDIDRKKLYKLRQPEHQSTKAMLEVLFLANKLAVNA